MTETNYDVVIAGTGAAGLAAAIVADSLGLRVLLVEKTKYIGGTTAYSGAACWVPGSDQQRAQGIEDGFEQAALYLDNVIESTSGREARHVYLRRAPEAFRELEQISLVRFHARPYTPDYSSEIEGAINYGRVLIPENFDGNLLGERFMDLRPPLPELCLFGSSMIDGNDLHHLINARTSFKSAVHSVKLIARDLKDRVFKRRFGRGLRLTAGNAMIAQMYKTVLDRKIPVLLETPIIDLVNEGGRIVGVKVRPPGADTRVIRVAKGVVLATGGFPWSKQLREKYVPDVPFGYSAASVDSTGDGIEIAMRESCQFDDANSEGVFLSPVSMGQRTDGTLARFPHLMADRSKPGLIAVNAQGERFCNESQSYHEVVRAMIGRSTPSSQMPVHLICDHAFVSRFAFGMVPPLAYSRRRHIKSGYLMTANTIEELGTKIGVPSPSLRRTLDEYNEDARRGLDSLFSKGSTRYNRHLGDPLHQPNPCLAPIERGPYYAIRVHAGDLGTSHGIAVDEYSRALSTQGVPVPGLYVCGNDRSSIMGGNYPSGGITVGPALTFAYLAMRHAAGLEGADEPDGEGCHAHLSTMNSHT